MFQPSIAIVTTETRLRGLLSRWGTRAAAEFRLRTAQDHELLGALGEKAGAVANAQKFSEFEQYEQEDAVYNEAIKRLRTEVDVGLPTVHVPRAHLPSFDFRNSCAVVVAGPDGLVANTAKYVGELPILGVNTDTSRFDGVLLPFSVENVRQGIQRVLKDQARVRNVTMGRVTLNDGQTLLAFNDFFIGCATHTSARYTIQVENESEPHSSSGIIVSTGAGSTGWLSSVFNMMRGIDHRFGGFLQGSTTMEWEDRKLAWVVREPFVSRQSSANLVAGTVTEGSELKVESMMPDRGVIFSDGVETDSVQFNSGSVATVDVAPQCARLVIP